MSQKTVRVIELKEVMKDWMHEQCKPVPLLSGRLVMAFSFFQRQVLFSGQAMGFCKALSDALATDAI